jgi:Na+-driven multidrug efflux pump
VTLVGALVTIPVSPALIFGLGPIPHLGIAGAGLAFGLYYGAAMLFLLRYMSSGASGLRLHVVPLRARIFGDMLKVGIPTALNTVLTNLTVILVTGAVGLFGTSALAGYGIASRLDYIMIPLLFGISTATLTMVGVNMGAGQSARAQRIGWVSGAAGFIMTGSIGLLVAIVPTAWLHLFSRDPDVVSQGTIYLRIVAPAYAALGFGFVTSFAALGAGRGIGPLISSIARILIAGGGSWIAVTYIGAGMTGLAIMVAAAIVAYAAICVLIMLSPATWRVESRN